MKVEVKKSVKLNFHSDNGIEKEKYGCHPQN